MAESKGPKPDTTGKMKGKPGNAKRPAAPAHVKAAHGPKRAKASHDDQYGGDASNLQHAKATAQERKAAKRSKSSALKKNFNIIQDAAQLWEALRPKNISPEEKHELVEQILSKINGKIIELANHHTASRIIQLCAKEGTPAQRDAIMAEVRGSMVELSKTKYGHHFVQRLVALAKSKDEVAGLVSMFKGKVAELLRHPHGADVLTDLYDVASTSQRNAMCAEFYGREFVLFDGVGKQASTLSSLRELLEGTPTSKRRAVYMHMTRTLTPVMEKAILHPPMVHRLVRDFLECAPSMSVEDAVDTLSQTGTDVLKMVHTHEGAAATCMLVSYGSAKDRKRLLKAMKGHVHDMAVNEWGHAVLCTTLSVTDDTALVNKTVTSELKAMLAEAVGDAYASRVLLQLLSPDDRRYLPQAVLEMMHPAQRTIAGSTGKMVTDLEGDEDDVDVHAGLGGEDDGDELFPAKGKSASGREAAGAPSPAPRGSGGDLDDAPGDDADDGAAAAPRGPRVLGLSKKDPVVRRRELLGSGGSSLAAALTAEVAERAGELLRSPHGCNVVVEAARGGEQGILAEACPDGVAAVTDRLAALLRRGKDEPDAPGVSGAEADDAGDAVAGPAPQQEHVMTHYYASRALRRLVLSADGGPPSARACVQALWSEGLKGRCGEWAGTHGDKVLAALVRCGVPSVSSAVTKELRPLLREDPVAWADSKAGKTAKHTKGGKGSDKASGAKATKAGAKAETSGPAKAAKAGAKPAGATPKAVAQKSGDTPKAGTKATPKSAKRK